MLENKTICPRYHLPAVSSKVMENGILSVCKHARAEYKIVFDEIRQKNVLVLTEWQTGNPRSEKRIDTKFLIILSAP